MGMFGKMKSAAGAVGNATASAAATATGTVVTSAKENAKIAGINGELATIENQLNNAYEQIGKKYVEVAMSTGEVPDIGIMDILNSIEPKLDKKSKLEQERNEIEKELKDQLIMTEKAAATREFEAEKAKLDKALGMEVVSQEEYDQKISVAQKKLDSFAEVRRLDEQLSMGIITKKEHTTKISELGI